MDAVRAQLCGSPAFRSLAVFDKVLQWLLGTTREKLNCIREILSNSGEALC